MTAATGTQVMWYFTRATGLVALVLLTASVVLGIVETSTWSSPRWPRFVIAALHRNISLLVMIFLAGHVATAVLDSFAPIGWLDSVVPFLSPYRPIWLGLGAVSFDLLLAVIATSLLRRRLGYPAWRAVHWLSYACWPIALVHGFGTGSDTRIEWVLLLSLGCLAAVLAAVWWRLWKGWPAAPELAPLRTAATVASIVVPVVVVAWLLVGPLRPGWSSRAGTPKALPTATATATATAAAEIPATRSALCAARRSRHDDHNRWKHRHSCAKVHESLWSGAKRHRSDRVVSTAPLAMAGSALR
jgi:sulfoxide reductase heme-binding subunit YedZ